MLCRGLGNVLARRLWDSRSGTGYSKGGPATVMTCLMTRFAILPGGGSGWVITMLSTWPKNFIAMGSMNTDCLSGNTSLFIPDRYQGTDRAIGRGL